MVQSIWDEPRNVVGRGCNGLVQKLISPLLPNTIMKAGLQRILSLEAELLTVCRHPKIMQAYAILMDQKATAQTLGRADFWS